MRAAPLRVVAYEALERAEFTEVSAVAIKVVDSDPVTLAVPRCLDATQRPALCQRADRDAHVGILATRNPDDLHRTIREEAADPPQAAVERLDRVSARPRSRQIPELAGALAITTQAPDKLPIPSEYPDVAAPPQRHDQPSVGENERSHDTVELLERIAGDNADTENSFGLYRGRRSRARVHGETGIGRGVARGVACGERDQRTERTERTERQWEPLHRTCLRVAMISPGRPRDLHRRGPGRGFQIAAVVHRAAQNRRIVRIRVGPPPIAPR